MVLIDGKYDKNATFAFPWSHLLALLGKLNNNIDKQLYYKACSAKCKYLFLSQEVLVLVEATGNYLTVKIILRAKYMYYHQSFCISSNAPKFLIS